MTDVMDALLRASATFGLVVLALPVVAAIERFRGQRTALTSVGPRGARTAIATALKLLEKRAPRAIDADRLIGSVAPVFALVPTLSMLAVLPTHAKDEPGSTLPLLISLPLLATGAIGLAGHGAQSPLALLTALRLVALRAAALVVVAVAALGPLRAAGTVELSELARAQAVPLLGALPHWGIVAAPTSFFAAVIALAVVAKHVQRSRTEASLNEPWFGDATGPVLLGHRLFENVDLLASAGMVAVVFLGAWHAPYVQDPSPALGAVILGVKILLSLLCIVAARNLLPRMTHAQAIRTLWLALLPLALSGVVVVEWVR
jgi:NADH-quinone oxidoreductase subunit H